MCAERARAERPASLADGAAAAMAGGGDGGVRRAGAGDLERIRELTGAAYARYRDRMELPPRPVLADYGTLIEAGHVWVTGTPIIGLIVLVPGDDALLIESVAVDPAAQGTGQGRRLMDFAQSRASAAGLRRLTLYTNEVMTENQAIYLHLGYREVGRRIDQGYRVVLMAKALPPPR